ncbi:MAG: CXXX repeat peptide maturase [Prevotella sp.]|nr:CXXX repeat peptide maturase [Prevotella sp.]
MLKYLVVLLDDASTSFCHYDCKKNKSYLMPIETLKKGIRFGMMENLMIQFVYPEESLPAEYNETIETIDHGVLAPVGCPVNADAVVFNDWDSLLNFEFSGVGTFVVRTELGPLLEQRNALFSSLSRMTRINIVLTDIEKFKEEDFGRYDEFLSELGDTLKKLFLQGYRIQCNLLTDRIDLDTMNNCNAGTESITLAPDGKLYLCPGFYYYDDEPVGNLDDGINIKNQQLLRLDHAPLCRICDAFQCKRCIWLNKKTTLEVNTPSHEQCVVAHLERNQSRRLLAELQGRGLLDKKNEIKEISYLDPFDVKEEW